MTDDDGKSIPKGNTKYIILNKNTIHNQKSHANISRKLLCVEYPGIVENVDNMIETLGGMHNIEMAVGNSNRRLELKFRPDDIFCKPTWGDKDYSCRILVKIKVQTPRRRQPLDSETVGRDNTVYQYESVGLIPMTFKFSRLCDFQYLPLVPKDNSVEENSNTVCHYIYNNIIPPTLPDMKWFESDESKKMPFFFPPPVFAKFNSSKDNKLYYRRYKYYEKVLPEVAERLKKESFKKQEPKNIISSRSRLFRTANSIFVNFNAKDVTIPQYPNEAALSTIQRRGVLSESGPMEKIQELFEERPIWSKSALLHKSGVRKDHMKVILPAVAYYCYTGPWRIMWCRFGYDPTKDPTSRIYQTFDFRIRASGGLKVKVQAKRSYSSSTLHYRAGPSTNQKFSLNYCTPTNPVTKQGIDERFYILKPGMLPAARQMFYQYCDLHLPEIEDMITRLPKITQDLKYHRKNGWLPNGFHDQCREICNKYVAEAVRNLLLEEKKKDKGKTKQDLGASSAQSKYSTPAPKPDVTILGATIVIDSDNEDESMGKNPDEEAGSDDEQGEDPTHTSDSEEDGRDDLEDIDLEAVEEIIQIIGNQGELEQTARCSNDKDSDEEFDPDLVNLYKRLILSNNENK